MMDVNDFVNKIFDIYREVIVNIKCKILIFALSQELRPGRRHFSPYFCYGPGLSGVVLLLSAHGVCAALTITILCYCNAFYSNKHLHERPVGRNDDVPVYEYYDYDNRQIEGELKMFVFASNFRFNRWRDLRMENVGWSRKEIVMNRVRIMRRMIHFINVCITKLCVGN
jgi:hypothetical protein